MITFKVFAGTDVGLRDNNEDNFIVCPDLKKCEWIIPADHRQEIPLSDAGCLLVVADGMGGQNAGEVASEIAIETVKTRFTSSLLSQVQTNNPDAVKQYLCNTIIQADEQVKAFSKEHPETEGMGSTLVIAWILGNKIYVAWIGDSRAYSCIASLGIARLTKDHSYVQQLVDMGRLTEEQAMDDPNSNIITRSLGDFSQKAKPDVAEYVLHDGEVVMLCSDGLCGVCPDGLIGRIIEANSDDLQKCREQLTNAALAAGGSDNITIALLQVVSGCDEPAGDAADSADTPSPLSNFFRRFRMDGIVPNWLTPANVFAIIFALAILSCLFYAGYYLFSKQKTTETVHIPVTISIKLGKKELRQNESTKLTIETNAVLDSIELVFSPDTLITFNKNDSTISGNCFKGKEEVKIIAQYKCDRSFRDSVTISLLQGDCMRAIESQADTALVGSTSVGDDDVQDGESSNRGNNGVSGEPTPSPVKQPGSVEVVK